MCSRFAGLSLACQQPSKWGQPWVYLIMKAGAFLQVPVASANGAKPLAILAAQGLHGSYGYTVLAHCFSQVQDVSIVNSKRALFFRHFNGLARMHVSCGIVFLFDFQVEGLCKG